MRSVGSKRHLAEDGGNGGVDEEGPRHEHAHVPPLHYGELPRFGHAAAGGGFAADAARAAAVVGLGEACSRNPAPATHTHPKTATTTTTTTTAVGGGDKL